MSRKNNHDYKIISMDLRESLKNDKIKLDIFIKRRKFMIEFKDIVVSYGNKNVFNGFNLKIEKGHKVLLNAPSGAGKSTLFRLLLGFDKPKSGVITVQGKKIDRSSIMDIRSKISYVSQDVDLRKENLKELLEEIFTYRGNRDKKFDVSKLQELLKEYNLSDEILDKNVSQLSGGERQRIGLIIAMLLDRDIWILDEVTSALDKELKEKVARNIIAQDKTVIIISHDSIWSEMEEIIKVRW